MKKIILRTARLEIKPKTLEQMKALYDDEKSAEMKQAYNEMIQGMKNSEGNEQWSSYWTVTLLTSGIDIGGLCFKGMPDETGSVEIGYGIDQEYQNNGYATESVSALVKWALNQKGVSKVTAETDISNEISQKVLIKNGFIRDGEGIEGPRFVCGGLK